MVIGPLYFDDAAILNCVVVGSEGLFKSNAQ